MFLRGIGLPPPGIYLFLILSVPFPPLFPWGVKGGLGRLGLFLVKFEKGKLTRPELI
jgi:hypothetical protein